MAPIITSYVPLSDNSGRRSPRARRREAMLAAVVFGGTLLFALLVR